MSSQSAKIFGCLVATTAILQAGASSVRSSSGTQSVLVASPDRRVELFLHNEAGALSRCSRQEGTNPTLNPGSPTYPLDVSAALSEDHKALTIAVLNPSDSQRSIRIVVNGAKLTGAGTLWRMAPDSIDATIQVDKKPEVQVEQSLGALPDVVTVRPFNVNIYSYPLE